jgi:hypothetical protein
MAGSLPLQRFHDITGNVSDQKLGHDHMLSRDSDVCK